MEIYKLPIEVAIIIFPFIAFTLTIPFLIYHYRKYGAIHFLKSIIFYSLILYLITAYFLVILPLPSIAEVSKMTKPIMQLSPFNFINDIKTAIQLPINGIQDILSIINKPEIYTVAFNLLLVLPFGIYLRYYFQKKCFKTIIYCFLLSIFFELTQLSGLYGIYPRPYRLFDVDDLIINTLGGLLGYIITPIFMLILPSRQDLDTKSYKKGQKVTFLRRCIALFIDILFIAIFSLILKILFYKNTLSNYSIIIMIFVYYLCLPIFMSGQTIGKRIVKIRLASTTGEIRWYQLLLRNALLIFLTLYPITFLYSLGYYLNETLLIIIIIVIVIYQITNIIYYIFSLSNHEHQFLYERLTNTKNISLIKYSPIAETNCLIKKKHEKSNKKERNSCNNKNTVVENVNQDEDD